MSACCDLKKRIYSYFKPSYDTYLKFLKKSPACLNYPFCVDISPSCGRNHANMARVDPGDMAGRIKNTATNLKTNDNRDSSHTVDDTDRQNASPAPVPLAPLSISFPTSPSFQISRPISISISDKARKVSSFTASSLNSLLADRDRSASFHSSSNRSTGSVRINSRNGSPSRRGSVTDSFRRASMDVHDAIDIYHPSKTDSQGHFYLHPNSNLRRCMDMIAAVFVLWTCIIVPFDIGFEWWIAPGWLKIFSSVIDYFFVLDIILNFQTAYIEHGELFTDRKKIRLKYLKTWFLPDLFSVIPYEFFIGTSSSTRKSFKLAKLQKTPKYDQTLYFLRGIFAF
jgi:hypothetical protein